MSQKQTFRGALFFDNKYLGKIFISKRS